MNNQTFSLQPFPSADTQLLPHPALTGTPLLNKERGRGEVLNATWYEPIPNLKITGNIARQANQLTIHYALVGDLKEVAICLWQQASPGGGATQTLIATTSNTPARKHELWKDTCFEFFLGIKNSNQYWEFNLSPAGDWNVYRFDAYRQGMQEETAFTTLPFHVEYLSDGFTLGLDVNLDKIVLAEQVLEVGITTVIKSRKSEVSYWALTHPGTEADFHRRDSFIIAL